MAAKKKAAAKKKGGARKRAPRAVAPVAPPGWPEPFRPAVPDLPPPRPERRGVYIAPGLAPARIPVPRMDVGGESLDTMPDELVGVRGVLVLVIERPGGARAAWCKPVRSDVQVGVMKLIYETGERLTSLDFSPVAE